MRVSLIVLVVLLSLFVIPLSLAETPNKEIALQTLNTTDATASLVKVVLGLSAVLVAIFVSAWLFKRFARVGTVSNDALKIVGGLAVGSRERLLVLKVGDEQLLIGVTPGRIEKLHVLKTPLEIDSIDTKGGFAEKLSAALKKQS